MEDYRTFLFSYRYQGSTWGFDVVATSPEDAELRLKAIAFATYDGELKHRIRIPTKSESRLGRALGKLANIIGQ